MPDFKTIADFRKDNGPAIRDVCRQFIVLCRRIHLLDDAIQVLWVVLEKWQQSDIANNRRPHVTPN